MMPDGRHVISLAAPYHMPNFDAVYVPESTHRT